MAEYFEETSETLNLSDDITGLSAFYTSDVDTLVFSETLKSHENPVSFSESVVLSENVHGVDVKAASLTDRVDYSDAIAGPVDAPLLTDTLAFADTLTSDFSVGALDTLVFSETLVMLGGIDAASLSDTLRLDETLTSASSITGVLSDTVKFSDILVAGFSGSSTDTLVVSESIVTGSTSETVDSLVLSDLLASRMAIAGVVSDTVIASDEIGYGFVQSTADTLVASDVIAGTMEAASPVLTDTVVVGDVLAGSVAVYAASLTDTVVGSDSVTGSLALVGILSDTVLFGDTLSDAAYQVIVVVNAETGAVSTYTMTPVAAGLAEYRGTLYLAGPDGLYAMDATEDEDGEVVWTLRTGFSNLGSDLLKRVRDANILGRTEGDTLLKVVTSRGGQKQEYHYQLPEVTRDAYRDGVTKVGRGLQSVYWQFALQGTGPAEVDQLKLAIEPLSRRR
jgi:hypothetical protein